MLNLMPWREDKLARDKKTLYLILVCSLFATAIFILSYRQIIGGHCKKILEQNGLIKQKIIAMEKIKKKQDLAILNSKLFFENYWLLNRQQRILLILQEIERVFPGDSCLVSMGLENNSMLLSGILRSSSQETIKNFVKHIQKKLKLNVKVAWLKVKPLQEFEYKIAIDLAVRRV